MRISTKKALAVATLVLGMSFTAVSTNPGVAFAATSVIATTTATTTVQNTTSINWEKGEDADVTAVGVGFPPKNATSAAQGKLLARRAAVVDAQRNLVEVINGVSVDSETTVENLMVVSDSVKTKVNGIIKRATIISEKANADGSYQVVMRVPIFGVKDSLSLAVIDTAVHNAPIPAPAPLRPNVMAAYSTPEEEAAAIIEAAEAEAAEIIADAYKQADEIIAQAQQQVAAAVPVTESATAPVLVTEEVARAEEEVLPATAEAVPQAQMTVLNNDELKQLDSASYTGVIIDASGLGMEPTFSPVIYDTEKRPIYGMKNVDPKFAIAKGMVGYASSLEKAKTLSRVGANPLVLKAASVAGGKNSVLKVNAIVSVADGDRILLADQKNPMLNNAAVVFVK